MTRHQNNFDFVRLLAATLVLVSHHFAIHGMPEPALLGTSWGGISVQVFFTISGYLIAESWFRDPSFTRFLWRRVLRIWPGLVVMVMFTVLVLGPLASSWHMADYFTSPQTWAYLKALKVFALGGPLPGVFEGMPQDAVVNASLWTLPVEVRWYLILAVLGAIGLLRRSYTLPVVLMGLVIYIQTQWAPGERQDTMVLGQFFLIGAVLNRTQQIWIPRAAWLMPAAVFTGVILAFCEAFSWAQLLTVSAVAVGVGRTATPYLSRFGRYGDFSYGVYIYAFPIQQAVTQWIGHDAEWKFWLGLALSLGVTYAMAVLSWHFIEKRALSFKPASRTQTASFL